MCPECVRLENDQRRLERSVTLETGRMNVIAAARDRNADYVVLRHRVDTFIGKLDALTAELIRHKKICQH